MRKLSVVCKLNNKLSSIENKLYKKYPEYKNKCLFLANGELLNTEKTLDENRIKNGDTIIFRMID